MKKSIVVFLYLTYWIIYLFIFFLMFVASQQNHEGLHFPGLIMLNVWISCVLFPALISFYSAYTFLFSNFLKKKKITGLFFVSISVFIAGALTEDIYLSLMPGPGIFKGGIGSAVGISIMLFLVGLINAIMGFIVKGFVSWYGDIQLKVELNKKNYEMELALMKAQINPHFLFNTINNIDVLIQKEPQKASEYLNKLSDIMRFMLYEAKTDKILLSKEIEYIEKYIELQKIRTSNPNYIVYSIKGNPNNSMIEPMLFIPFIENAFKYAENKKVENAINLNIMIEKNKIVFECENYYEPNLKSNVEYKGLGNELIQRRLSLLYPNKHLLDITGKNGIHKVKLSIII